jgi:hypothetical protein
MTVSAIASGIYQAAKAACKGVWNWRLEWSKAMKQAWRKIMSTAKAKAAPSEIAAEIAGILGGNVWENYDKCRVYVYKNFLAINEDGIDLTGLGRNHYDEMKAAAHEAARKHGLEVYEIYRGRKIAA